MSLKAFHLVFITVACALAFGFGGWELWDYWARGGGWVSLLLGAGSVAGGLGLVVYERYFLKKLKNVSYL